MLLNIFVFAFIAGMAKAVMYHELVKHIPGKLNRGCYVELLDMVLPFHTAAPGPNCLLIKCEPTTITYMKCDIPKTDDLGCEIYYLKQEGSKELVYPDCCPKLKC